MPTAVIGLVLLIQGINLIWPVISAFWLGVILIVAGIYVIYKRKGEIRL